MLRGVWLVLGWALPILAYCFVFGGGNPMPVAKNLFFGPVEVATTGADVYLNLRTYVVQTLLRNALLYIFCFLGMALAWTRIFRLDGRTRIALIFSSIVTALVFAHNQPWPYVFIMALPFMALWSLELFDRLIDNRRNLGLAWLVLGIAIAVSLVRNIQYLRIDNASQLEVVTSAQRLVGPEDIYFDGVGMLPNRIESSTLWLDRAHILKTLREKQASEAYRIFVSSPPKVILWSYRMDAIEPVIAPLIQHSYVMVAPNIRIVGQRLRRGAPSNFKVPMSGSYRLYDGGGNEISGKVSVNGVLLDPPLLLSAGNVRLILEDGPVDALIIPEGNYVGLFSEGPDSGSLFAEVYN